METGGARSTGAGTAQDRIAQHQHAQEVLRARSILLVASGLWLFAGLPLDLVLVEGGMAGPLWFLLTVRLSATAYHTIVLATLYRDPTPRASVTDPLVFAVFPVTAGALAVISLRTDGPSSPYHAAIIIVMLVQALVSSKPWQRGVVETSITAAVLPVTFAIAAAIDPQTRAAFDERSHVMHFLVSMVLLGCAIVIMTWGGHILWTLRRSVFETRNIGRYRLLRRIGKGGMGEVWRAHDRATRRDVALKILSPEYGRQPAAIARFEREIEATASLTHAQIVRVFDWGVTADGVWYYAMELLEGIDMRSLVRGRGRLTTAVAVPWIAQASRAIAEAHRKGICHRDLTPGNLFVIVEGGLATGIKVLDFGVARIGAPEGDEGLTLNGSVLGTPGYIAPEVAAGAAAGPSADVWGLGAVLFFMLTTRNPRDAASAAGPTPPPSAIAVDVPAAVDDVIVRALDAVPARRYSDAGDLAAALEATGFAKPSTLPLRLDDLGDDITTESGETLLPDGGATSADAPSARSRGSSGKLAP